MHVVGNFFFLCVNDELNKEILVTRKLSSFGDFTIHENVIYLGGTSINLCQ